MSQKSVRRRVDALSMTASEWMEIAAVIRERWPHAALPVETLTRWGADLEDLPGAQVAATVEVLYREGREFPPNAGMIRSKLAELAVDPPDWDVALGQLRRIARASETGWRNMREDPEENVVHVDVTRPRDARLGEAHTLVRAFYQQLGHREIEEALADGAGSDEARMREKWSAFCRRAQREVVYAGIPAAGLARLEAATPRRANAEPRRLGNVLGELTAGDEAGERAA